MARAAFATWNDRIAPVFDVAGRLQVVQTEAGRVVGMMPASVTSEMPDQKASRLVELAIDTLVCGAISRSLLFAIRARGIEVIPFVAGDLQEIIQAWLRGKLTGSPDYAMPGCPDVRGHRHRQTQQGERRVRNVKSDVRADSRAGQHFVSSGPEHKMGSGSRQGRIRNGGTIKKDRRSSTDRSTCVCPQCGYRAPHERGIPCMQKTCARCGAVMTRR